MDNFLKDQPSVTFLCITHPKHIANNKEKDKMCIWPSFKCKNEKVKFQAFYIPSNSSGPRLVYEHIFNYNILLVKH